MIRPTPQSLEKVIPVVADALEATLLRQCADVTDWEGEELVAWVLDAALWRLDVET